MARRTRSTLNADAAPAVEPREIGGIRRHATGSRLTPSRLANDLLRRIGLRQHNDVRGAIDLRHRGAGTAV